MQESLCLKWGTLKSWKLDPEGPAFSLLKKYHEVGRSSYSAMAQSDNQAQKDLICEIIDALNSDTVRLDWAGQDISKEEAKKYIREYE